MRRGKTYILVIALLVAVIALAGIMAACGGDEAEETASPAASEPAAIEGSAMERATAILGREPTGLAKEIIDRGEILVANDPNYAPQSFIDETTNELVGFDVDVALGMAELLALEPVWKHPDWNTIPSGLTAGLYDVSIGSMTITPERQKNMDFTDPYYYTSGQIFVKKGGAQIAGPDDLAGKSVGVGDGTTYYTWLKDNTTAKVGGYRTDLDAVPDLLNGNIEFWMTAGPTGQQAILEGKPIEFSGKPLYYEDLAMAIKKGETDLVALLDYTVQTMHENGALTEMSKKWYNGIDLSVKE